MLSSDDLQAICRLLHEEAAIVYGENKYPYMRRQVQAFLEGRSIRDAGAFWCLLEEDPAARRSLIESLTINETRFFRMPSQFQALSSLLPDLAASRRSGMKRPVLRAWSAACSTGEEAYSLAIAASVIPDRTWELEVFATDLNEQVLKRARQGLYGTERLENVPPGVYDQLFAREPGGLRIQPRIRERVSFERHNLKALPPRGPWDLIWCRNVLIYFDNRFRAELLERFYEALAPGGYLFVGEAETLHPFTHRFEIVHVAGAVVYRRPVDRSAS